MLRAVPVTVSVAFILRENIAYDHLTRLSVSSSYQQPSIVYFAHAHAHRLYVKNTFFTHNLNRQLALDFVVMRPNGQTACGAIARVTIENQ